MPTLTGTIADVTGTRIPPTEVVEVLVKAPAPRVSGGNPSQVITTVTVPVTVETNGSISVTLDPGVAVLVVRTVKSHDTFSLQVTADMTTIREAIIETIGALPELDQSQLVQLAAQARADAVQVAGDKAEVSADHTDIEQWHGEIMPAVAQVASDRQAASVSEENAAASAASASDSASGAASSETSAAASAASAVSSASSASDSSTAASADRQTVQGIRDDLQALLNDSDAWAGFQDALAQLEPRMAAKIDELKGGAPAAFDTLGEIADELAANETARAALANSVAEAGKKAEWDQVLGKPGVFPTNWGLVDRKPSTFPPDPHTHPVDDIDIPGSASTSTYLRGDRVWAKPPNTTYNVPPASEAIDGVAQTPRVFTAERVRQSADAAIADHIKLVSEFPSSPVAGVLYLKEES